MSESKPIIAERIKSLRKEKGFTQEQLAEYLGLNAKSSIANYESGANSPSDEIKRKMCELFNCSMDYLMGKSEYKTQQNDNSLENAKNYYEQKIDILLKNKYIDKFSKLKLSNYEIENLIKIITSEKDAIAENYYSLYNSILSILSLNHNEDVVNKVKDLIQEYNQEKIDILNEEMNFYIKKQKEQEEEMKKQHFDKIHPSISGKESASLDENIEALLNYMDKNNIDNVCLIPIIGKITAGQPILAEEYLEGYLPVDPNIYGITTPDDYFYLKVSGESMNLKVHNGDYALIHKQDYAENGDIIVAIVNGDDEATMKRYKKINNEIIMLEPMSTLPMEPIVINLKETKFQIIGKAIGQFGKF